MFSNLCGFLFPFVIMILKGQHGMEIKRVKYYASDKILYDVYGNMCDEIKIKQQDKGKLKEELIHNAETGLAYVYFKKK